MQRYLTLTLTQPFSFTLKPTLSVKQHSRIISSANQHSHIENHHNQLWLSTAATACQPELAAAHLQHRVQYLVQGCAGSSLATACPSRGDLVCVDQPAATDNTFFTVGTQ